MLLLDDRAGSRDLAPYLARTGIEHQLGRLEFGDAAFYGNGPDGVPVFVGVEYKSLPDVLACITSGRYAGHQLPGMLGTYQVSWLLIEGIWKGDPDTGVLMLPRRGSWIPVTIGRRRYMAADLDAWLLSVTQQTGTRIHRVSSDREAADWLVTLYKWWTSKTWDDHKTHQTFDLSGPVIETRPPSFARRVAKELTGVGWKKSAIVVEHFPTVQAMVCADERDWRAVPGIGKTLAHAIVQELSEPESEEEG